MTEQEATQLLEVRDQQAFSLCSKLVKIEDLDSRNFPVVLGMIAAKLVDVAYQATREDISKHQSELFIESFLMDLSLHTGLTLQIVQKEDLR
jgi:hypothetical protein